MGIYIAVWAGVGTILWQILCVTGRSSLDPAKTKPRFSRMDIFKSIKYGPIVAAVVTGFYFWDRR